MKKIFFTLIFLFSINYTFADSWVSTVTWNWSSRLKECWSSTSHSLTHYWVPNSINSNPWSAWWTVNCTTHAYYSSSDHIVSFSYNWWISACPAWERVVNWNERARTMTCRKYDDVIPVRSDITTSVPNNLLANSAYTYTLNLSNRWGSPIDLVEWNKENVNDQGLTSFSDTSSPWSQTWDISKVDNFRVNWWRQYTLNIIKMCDEAWNCWTWTNTFNHNVYANTNSIATKSFTEQLSNSSNIADWTNKNLTINLADTYWNKIVPASGISRTIDFNFEYNNDLYLNQFTWVWASAVYTDYCWSVSWLNQFPIWSFKSCNWETWSNWTYNYWFKIYSPTYNIYNKSSWDFTLNNITFDVNWTIWAVSSQWLNWWSAAISSKYNPLYYTNISWSQRSGFIEWVVQNGNLSITKNSSSINPTSRWTFLAFWWNTRDYEMKYSNTGNPSILISTWTLSTDYWISSLWLRTKLIQKANTSTSSNVYLSSHIKYDLDGLNIIYNSDIIWSSRYLPSGISYLAWEAANQSQLKIYGTVWTSKSTRVNSFTNNQAWNIKEVNWWFDKALLKWSILEWVTRIVNSVWNTPTWSPNIINDLISSTTIWHQWWLLVWDKKNILLYKWNNIVSLHNWDYDWTPIWISWKKTIVIYWWNLYINKDMYYSDSNSNLWIIVMKDSAWNWWNIYISPKVTNLVGTIYASKSLLSASIGSPNSYSNESSMTYYDWNADADDLKNQLYIYWSLFSSNTLGWSKSSPKKCPYYVSTRSCDADTSIKYDLNFLRRYYLVDNWTYKCPANWWHVIWWALTCTNWAMSSFTSNLKQLFTNTSSSDAAYPLIIKYNSNLQTNPPPLFSNN